MNKWKLIVSAALTVFLTGALMSLLSIVGTEHLLKAAGFVVFIYGAIVAGHILMHN
jgi:hypothetical protein